MGSKQGEIAQSSVNAIDDLIQECYLLERAGKMILALQLSESEWMIYSLGENERVR